MADLQTYDAYLAKAEENLACAESEYSSGRYNSCANRCYYACYQAAVAALMLADIAPRGPRGKWRHDFVSASFDGILIARRKLYSSSLRDVLANVRRLRETADYGTASITQRQADRALRQGREFVRAVLQVRGINR